MADWENLKDVLKKPEKYGSIRTDLVDYQIDGGTVTIPESLTGVPEQKYRVRKNQSIYWQPRFYKGKIYLAGSKQTARVYFSPKGMTDEKIEQIKQLMATPYGNKEMEAEGSFPTIKMTLAEIGFDFSGGQVKKEKVISENPSLENGEKVFGTIHFYPIVCMPDVMLIDMGKLG